MQPTVGRSVHYQRGGQTLHAVITRVEPKPMPAEIAAATGFDEVNATTWRASEDAYEVWLAVFLHTATIGSVEFSPAAIPYCAGPIDKTWSWPPRVP